MSRTIDRVNFGFTGFDEISLLYYDENKNLVQGRKLNDNEFFALYDFMKHNKNVENKMKNIYKLFSDNRGEIKNGNSNNT